MSSDVGETGPYLGAMLRVVWQGVREEIHAGVVAAGYDDLNPAHIELFRFPSPDGLRPSELATKVQLSKQAVNDVIGYLEASGYLVRQSDPEDGRARVIRLTAKGHTLEETVHAQAARAEARVATILGPQRFAQLRQVLAELAQDFTRGAASSTEVSG